MRTLVDCIPCILRQSLAGARLVSEDPAVHERLVRDVMRWAAEMDLNQPPVALVQRIQRRLRGMTDTRDPYRTAKERLNTIALELLPSFRADVRDSADPLLMASRLAIAGNVMDMGAYADLKEEAVRDVMRQALAAPFSGELEKFRRAIAEAQSILYLADNAGEIAFDRLLIEQLDSKPVTIVVRGSAVLNDATRSDALVVGLDELAEIIDNGSDAPGTVLDKCSPEFRRRFAEADLIIAKGGGNFESLNNDPGPIFFLFKVKCEPIAKLIGQPNGMQVLMRTTSVPAAPVAAGAR
ncbi:MAG: damage-control phosphatase ARMT1 family protein [Anaerolineales bacterium]